MWPTVGQLRCTTCRAVPQSWGEAGLFVSLPPVGTPGIGLLKYSHAAHKPLYADEMYLYIHWRKVI